MGERSSKPSAMKNVIKGDEIGELHLAIWLKNIILN